MRLDPLPESAGNFKNILQSFEFYSAIPMIHFPEAELFGPSAICQFRTYLTNYLTLSIFRHVKPKYLS